MNNEMMNIIELLEMEICKAHRDPFSDNGTVNLEYMKCLIAKLHSLAKRDSLIRLLNEALSEE